LATIIIIKLLDFIETIVALVKLTNKFVRHFRFSSHFFKTDPTKQYLTNRSTLMAVRLSIEAVQHMTSHAIHASQRASPSVQFESFTCFIKTQHVIFTKLILSSLFYNCTPPRQCRILNRHWFETFPA